MRWLVSAVFFAVYTLISAQYRFDHLSVVDGLSQNSVNDIYQDSEGYMWFATQDGLNRFDGYEFTQYMEDGSIPTSHNFLWSIVEDQYGNIWTASSKGATRLNWKEGKSTHFLLTREEKYEGERNQVARILMEDESILISSEYSSSFIVDPNVYPDSSVIILSDHESFIYKEIDPIVGPIFNMVEVGGQKFFLYHNKVVGKDPLPYPEGFTVRKFSSEVFVWKNGFFIGTHSGLLYYDITNSAFSTISCIDNPIFDITWGPRSEVLWIATSNGITFFDPTTFECNGKIQSGDKESDLSSNQVSAIAKSRDGVYWVGTSNGGINIYDPQKDQFKYLTKRHGLSDKPVWSIYKTKTHLLVGTDNGLYVSTHKGSITDGTFAMNQLLDAEKVKHPHFSDKRITAIEELNPGRFLIGTHSAELILYDLIRNNSSLLKLEEDNKHPHAVSAIKKIADDVWVSTHNGLFKFSPDLKRKQYYSYWKDPDNYPSNYYLSAYVSEDSTLWLGSNFGFITISTNGEIEYFDYDSNNSQKSPAFNFVSGFYEDKSGKIWVSTFGGGVSCLDRKNKLFFHLTNEDGLANNICSSVLGNDEFVFVTTNSGLSRIRIDDNQITNYTISDGLISGEFAIASAFQSQNEFFFGTVNGLIAFDPFDLNEIHLSQPPVVSKLSVNYSDVFLNAIENGELQLYPEDKIFSFQFSNLSFRKNDQMTFQYRMLGFDEKWVETSKSNRRATYSLEPGKYEFQLKSKVGMVESEASFLSIEVNPTFYETWWFYLMMVITTGIGIVLASRYYSHQQLKSKLRKLELQQKIQKERERISRDLHDNVGSQITYIASSIDNISGNGTGKELKELGDFTRDTMRQLRETIWVMNHDNVSLPELKIKIVDYLSEALRPYPEIHQEVHFPVSNEKLVPTTAINIFRIIQEAVNNAIKHASPGIIEVCLELGDNPHLAISDDGVGFDGKNKDGHFGLMNMRSRALELGANFTIASSQGEGTKIEVTGFEIGQMT